MNILELHRKTLFYINQQKSARFLSDSVDGAINDATTQLINQKFLAYRNALSYFEANQRIKDELYTIVVKDLPIVPVNNILAIPTDYFHEVGISVVIDGSTYPAYPVLQKEVNVNPTNFYTRPSLENITFEQTQNGFTIIYGNAGVLTQGKLTYLQVPPQVFISSVAITSGLNVLVDGSSYLVTAGQVTNNGNIYNVDDVFTAVGTAMTGGGTVVLVQNSILPSTFQLEIAIFAASILAASVKDYATQKNLLEKIAIT